MVYYESRSEDEDDDCELDNSTTDSNKTDNHGYTLFHLACKMGVFMV